MFVVVRNVDCALVYIDARGVTRRALIKAVGKGALKAKMVRSLPLASLCLLRLTEPGFLRTGGWIPTIPYRFLRHFFLRAQTTRERRCIAILKLELDEPFR